MARPFVRKTDDEEYTVFRILYESGFTQPVIADALGMTRSGVKSRAKRWGFAQRPGGRPCDNERLMTT